MSSYHSHDDCSDSLSHNKMMTTLCSLVHCRLKIKLSGSGLAAQQGSNARKGASKDGLDRWMAECADCGEEGDLLCCEVAGLHLQA